MRVGIVAKRTSDRAVALARDVTAGVEASDVTVVVDDATHARLSDGNASTHGVSEDGGASGGRRDTSGGDGDSPQDTPAPPAIPVADLADCDLAVSVGGDGTFLSAARAAGTTPLVGINLGEVGFLTAVEPDDAVETVRAVVDEIRERGAPRTVDVPRLAVAGPDWTLGPAVNEVVLQGPRRGHGGGLDVTVDVDEERFASGHADGVLVATPLGSTAYNVSEGGPLVQPGVDGLVVTDMAGALDVPPLVVRGGATVRLAAEGAPAAVAVTDGLDRRELTPPATVEVRLAAEPLAIAEPSIDFFAALAKLD